MINRVQPGGWSPNQTLLSTEITQLDINAANALDSTTAGDTLDGYINVSSTGGINFSSGSDLVVADGANVNLHVGSGSSMSITGSGQLKTLSGGRIVLSDNDYPTFSVPRTKSKLISFIGKYEASLASDWILNPGYAAIQSTVNGAYMVMDLTPYMIHGANLVNVRLTFTVGENHGAIPSNIPWMRVIRYNSDATSFNWLKTSALPSGQVEVAAPISGADWFNGGTPRYFDYVTDQYQTIDTANYTYALDFQDEYGVGAFAVDGNTLNSVKLEFNNIVDMKI